MQLPSHLGMEPGRSSDKPSKGCVEPTDPGIDCLEYGQFPFPSIATVDMGGVGWDRQLNLPDTYACDGQILSEGGCQSIFGGEHILELGERFLLACPGKWGRVFTVFCADTNNQGVTRTDRFFGLHLQTDCFAINVGNEVISRARIWCRISGTGFSSVGCLYSWMTEIDLPATMTEIRSGTLQREGDGTFDRLCRFPDEITYAW